MTQTLSVMEVTLKHFNLSVTLRDNGESAEILEELAYRTIGMWLWIAENLEKGIYKLPAYEGLSSVESRYADELTRIQLADTDAPPKEPFEFVSTFGDSRVTCWDSYRGSKRINFHLNSDDDLQTAVNTWLATQNATRRAFEKWGDVESKLDHAKASQPAQDAPPASAPYNPATDAPATPKASNTPSAPVEGAIVATRAPNSNRPDYANGQLVSFTVTKIVASSNKGSAVYQMWTPLGTQYPTLSIYKFKPNSQDLKPDYEAIVPVLNKLGLSLDKPEAMGTWRLVCRAAHVPNKEKSADMEYLNVVSLTAI